MRIGIDALYWLPNSMGGTQTYFLSLLDALSATTPKDEYVVYLNATAEKQFSISHPNVTTHSAPIDGKNRLVRLAWENLALPLRVNSDRLDIFHALGYLLPRGVSAPSVVTVLDMIHYARPKDISSQKMTLWRRMFPDSLKRADRVIAISNSVKNDICTFFPWAENKIHVTPLAVDHTLFNPPASIDIHTTLLPSGRPFILGVASLAAHKNLDGLVRAYAMVRSHFPDFDLCLVGMKSPAYAEISSLVEELKLESHVIFTGRVPDHELVNLYHRAEMLVFPSHYEGFGLPVLEAMACGCPVVASDRYSVPEVAGDAALLIDPRNTEQIADAIMLVIQSAQIKSELIDRGLRRSMQFTWQRTAHSTHDVYQSLAR